MTNYQLSHISSPADLSSPVKSKTIRYTGIPVLCGCSRHSFSNLKQNKLELVCARHQAAFVNHTHTLFSLGAPLYGAVTLICFHFDAASLLHLVRLLVIELDFS